MRGLVVGCVVALLGATPVLAVDVTFTGLVADTCTLAVPTPGVMSLSGDGKTLSSDLADGIGVPATLTIGSLGANNITVGAPAMDTYPAGYTTGSETLQLKYTGTASHAYTSSSSSFSLGIIPAASIVIDMKVTNNAGFVQGTYTAKTVVTCS